MQHDRKKLCFLPKDLDENKKKRSKVGLKMLKLGMSTQIVQFN